MDDEPEVIQFDVNSTSWVFDRRIRWAGVGLGAVLLVGCILRRSPALAYLFPVVIIGVNTWSALRNNRIVVNPDRVKIPLRRAVEWPTVEGVESTGRWATTVTLRLNTGKAFRTGLPSRYAEQVARIGRVPMLSSREEP